MDVRMPDGTIVKNVPEGTTKAEVMARYEGGKPEKKGFGENLVDATIATIYGIQDALTFGVADEISAGISTLTGIGGKFGDYAANQRAYDEYNRSQMKRNPTSALAGQVGGGMAMGMAAPAYAGLNFPRAVGLGALEGATYGYNASPEGERLRGAAFGSAGGAGGAALGQGLSRILSPRTSASARKLIDEGVDVTPGQALGGVAKQAEDVVQGIPVVGAPVRAARQRGITSFNRAAINRALKPVGKQLPKGVDGYDAIARAQEELSSAYDDLLPGITVRADDELFAGLKRIADEATELPEERMKQLGKIISRQVGKRFKGSAMTGEAMKEAESELGRTASQYIGSADADQRALGFLLRNVQEELRRAVERSNPGKRLQLANINRGYANLARVERAAAYAKDGSFTPGQLQSATRILDKSRSKKASAAGRALMQDLATAGREVLPQSVPDSGTAGRYIVADTALGLLGGGSAGLLTTEDPRLQALGVLGLLTAGTYTAPGQRAAVAAVAKRPEVARELAKIVEKGTGGAAIGGAVLALPSQP